MSACVATFTDLVEALLYTMQEDGIPQPWVNVGVCGDDTQEGGHVGVNHPTAFGYTSNSHLLPLDVCLQSRCAAQVRR